MSGATKSHNPFSCKQVSTPTADKPNRSSTEAIANGNQISAFRTENSTQKLNFSESEEFTPYEYPKRCISIPPRRGYGKKVQNS